MSAIGNATIWDDLGLAHQPATEGHKKELGQGDFLQLMIAQIKHQDPFKPMENGEFLGQMAQFSTVNGIQELQNSFATLSESLQSYQTLQATSLVGRSVLVPGGKGTLSETMPLEGEVCLPESVDSMALYIADEQGTLVKRMDMGSQPAGRVPFSWDGTLEGGERAAPGRYQVRAEALVDGKPSGLVTYVYADIQSVTLGSGGQGPTLNLVGAGSVPLDQVSQFR